jgi:hypothetical protein
MYTLQVFFDGRLDHLEVCRDAAGTLARIPELLREHDGCEKIVVMFGDVRLFAVDCKGNRLPA